MKKKAKVLFINKSEKSLQVLLGLRKTETEEFWWLPGGSVEGEENAFEALLRELEEELITGPIIKSCLDQFLTLDKEPSSIKYSRTNAEYIIFIIPLPDEALTEEIKIIEEFSEFRWFTYPNLPENLSREFTFYDNLKDL